MRTSRAVRGALLWLVGLVLLPVLAFQLGVDHYDRTYCTGPGDDGDCDLGVLTGLMWGIGTLLAYCVLTLVVAYARKRRSRAA